MKKLSQLFQQKEFHLFVFSLFFLLCCWPFLNISAKNGFGGVFKYLIIIFVILICFLFIISRCLSVPLADKDSNSKGGDGNA